MTGLFGRLRAHREAKAEAPADDDIKAYLAAARNAPITPPEPYVTRSRTWDTDLAKRHDA